MFVFPTTPVSVNPVGKDPLIVLSFRVMVSINVVEMVYVLEITLVNVRVDGEDQTVVFSIAMVSMNAEALFKDCVLPITPVNANPVGKVQQIVEFFHVTV